MFSEQEQHSERDNIERLNDLSLECREDDNTTSSMAALNSPAGSSSCARNLESSSSSSAAALSHVNNSQSDSVKTGNGSVVTGENDSSANNESDEVTAFKKRLFVIEELIKTEHDYVRDLKDVIVGYMAIMRDPNSDIPMPEDLRGGRDKIIFGNIEGIYEWHRE